MKYSILKEHPIFRNSLCLLLCLIALNIFNNSYLQAQTNTDITLKLIKEEIRKPSEKKQAIKGRELYTPNLELIGYEQFSEDRSKSYIETVDGNRFEVAPYQHTKIANKGNTIVKIGSTPQEEKINWYTCTGGFTVPQNIAFYNTSGQELKHYKNISSGLHTVISDNGYLVTCGGQIKNMQMVERVQDTLIILPEKTNSVSLRKLPPNVKYNHINNRLFTFAPNSYLTLYAPNGEKLWEKKIDNKYRSNYSILIDNYISTIALLHKHNKSKKARLTVFNQDGSIRFEHNSLATRASHYFLANDQYIAIHGLNGLWLLDSNSGKLLWENKTPLIFYQKNHYNRFAGIDTNPQNEIIILVTKGKYISQKQSEITHYHDWIQLLDIKTGEVVFKYNLGEAVYPHNTIVKMVEIIDDKHFKINGKNKSYYFEIEKN